MNVRTAWVRNLRIGGATLAACALSTAAMAGDGAALKSHAVLGDEGLQVELTGHGLQRVAELVKREVLGERSEMAVPDMHKTIAGGIELDVTGIKVGFSVSALTIVPQDGALAMRADVRNLKVRIDNLHVKKTVLGHDIGAGCTGTEFLLGSGASPVTLSTGLEASVADRAIVLSDRDTSFPIRGDQWRVRGPEECSGGWIISDILEFVVHQVFTYAYPFVEPVVKGQIHNTLPKLGEELTKQANLAVTIDLHDLPPLPERLITIAAYPHKIAINNDGMSVTVGVTFKGEDRQPGRAARAPLALLNGLKLGAVGLNPRLLTEALLAVFPDGTPELEIDETIFPQIKDVLTLESASAIWPDLNAIRTTESYLRVFVRGATMPVFTADQETQSIKIELPKVDLRFIASQNSAWHDYFNMHLAIASGIKLSMLEGVLSLAMTPGGTIGVAGEWANGYTPEVAEWEQDVPALLFSALLDYLVDQGPLFQIAVPELDVGGLPVAIDHPHVTAPYLRLDLVEAE